MSPPLLDSVDIAEAAWQRCRMAMRSNDDDLRGRFPRLLDALGQGLLLAGAGLFIAGVAGVSAAGGAWYGVTLGIVGLFTRAVANAVEAHAIAHCELTLPPQRSLRDGQSPATEQELMQLFELKQGESPPQFAARLEEEQHCPSAGRRV